jgi:hypothetical protein
MAKEKAMGMVTARRLASKMLQIELKKSDRRVEG